MGFHGEHFSTSTKSLEMSDSVQGGSEEILGSGHTCCIVHTPQVRQWVSQIRIHERSLRDVGAARLSRIGAHARAERMKS